MKMVVARPLDSVSPDSVTSVPSGNGSPSTAASIEQYQKFNTSLNAKLEFQNAEVDHWKQECERYTNDLKLGEILSSPTSDGYR